VPNASWTIAARAENVAFVRQSALDFLAGNGIVEPNLSDLQLAVSEAVTNAVLHAFRDRTEPGTVDVRVSVDARHVEIFVRDDGTGMAPRQDSPGLGLGLPLIRRLADQFDHREPKGGGTELRMRFSR